MTLAPDRSGGSGSAAAVEAHGAYDGYPLGVVTQAGSPAYDECFDSEGRVRPVYRRLVNHLASLSPDELATKADGLERSMRAQGITFTVHAGGEDSGDVERTFPLDLVPRLVDAVEWERLAEGLTQRVTALNAFVADVYGAREVLADGIVPTELVVTGKHFTRQATGLTVPQAIWTHVTGPDLIRDGDGRWLVLEDNCRTPSGVSYVLENRAAMVRGFPELFARHRVRPVDAYPQALFDVLREAAPRGDSDPTVVLLTPGAYNSAYFEHTFLARQMGIEIVEGGDLFVDDAVVYMRTTRGRKRVDVVYRRVDDDYLDPLAFRADSVLGVTGLLTAARAGNVAIANAVGTGIADDKAVFAYVPALIRYYLGQEPVLDQVPTYLCSDPDQLAHVLENLPRMVVKAVSESGGYGMTIGPTASDSEMADCRRRLLAKPRAYIAQETIPLSTHPTLVPSPVSDPARSQAPGAGGRAFRPRHCDLRPFVLMGADSVTIVPGGLSRVALPEGSLVVNSSQGGGSKDTWVVDEL
ncbi:MAG TPA: circularly permuted type 2 ATP-grasp protein [Mycobacteriales bacterium]|nr:circularly permuted type 2 ATP-grasp protein [Mycobacteriales bacterium]